MPLQHLNIVLLNMLYRMMLLDLNTFLLDKYCRPLRYQASIYQRHMYYTMKHQRSNISLGHKPYTILPHQATFRGGMDLDETLQSHQMKGTQKTQENDGESEAEDEDHEISDLGATQVSMGTMMSLRLISSSIQKSAKNASKKVIKTGTMKDASSKSNDNSPTTKDKPVKIKILKEISIQTSLKEEEEEKEERGKEEEAKETQDKTPNREKSVSDQISFDAAADESSLSFIRRMRKKRLAEVEAEKEENVFERELNLEKMLQEERMKKLMVSKKGKLGTKVSELDVPEMRQGKLQQDILSKDSKSVLENAGKFLSRKLQNQRKIESEME